MFSPDGRSLWVASPNHRAKVLDQWALHRFDPGSGRLLQPPIPTAGPVMSLAVTPNGRYLVGAVLGLHPEDRGPRDSYGFRRWRTASIMVWASASGRVVRKVDVNAENSWFTYMGLSPDGKSVTAWVLRQSDMLEGITFTVDGNEPPISLGLHPPIPRIPHMLSFQNNMRTALLIKDGRVYRWSVRNPGVLGPGVPAPFRLMANDPAPDGRSLISVDEGRLFDTGAWPPRPSAARIAHPGWLNEGGVQFSPDGRFLASWVKDGRGDRRLWRLPRPHSRPARWRAEPVSQPNREDEFDLAQFDSHGAVAVLWSPPGGGGRNAIQIVDAASGAARAAKNYAADAIRHDGDRPRRPLCRNRRR